jgi:hypothetical protein
MITESYDWFIEHRAQLASGGGSPHQSRVKLGVLRLLKLLP